MEDSVFQNAFQKFRNEIDITRMLREIRVVKAAVQSQLTEEQWQDIKKKHAVKAIWIDENNQSTQ